MILHEGENGCLLAFSREEVATLPGPAIAACRTRLCCVPCSRLTVDERHIAVRSGARRKESIYVLSPLTESVSQEGRDILIADLLVGIWRRRWIIAAVAILGGLAGFGLAQTTLRRFEATAILLIQSPQFFSELQPAALSVDAYRTLLNVDSTLSQVRDALIEKGVFTPGTDVRRLKGMVTTTIPHTEDRMQQSLPMIEIAAGANTPKEAEGIANTYARVFVQMSRDITNRGQEGALQLIESEYPPALERLQSAVVERKERQDHYARTQAALALGWASRISSFDSETDDLVAEYKKETKRLTLGV